MVLLWVTVVIVGLVIVGLLLAFTVETVATDEGGGSSTVKPDCSELTAGLPDIGQQECCAGQGIIKYNFDLAMDTSPSPVAYQSICRQYCPSGLYDMTTDTCTTEDPTILSQVSKCLTAIKPVECTGLARPVATSYGTLYYGLRANLVGCPQTTCPQ